MDSNGDILQISHENPDSNGEKSEFHDIDSNCDTNHVVIHDMKDSNGEKSEVCHEKTDSNGVKSDGNVSDLEGGR